MALYYYDKCRFYKKWTPYLAAQKAKVRKEPDAQIGLQSHRSNSADDKNEKTKNDFYLDKKLMGNSSITLDEKNLIFQEQVELSRVMIDFGEVIDDFYISLALQFGYIVFFGVYFPAGLFVLLIADICTLSLTAFAYSDHIKRSRSQDINSIGVWNKIFYSVGYLGVIYNGLIPIYPGSGLMPLFGTYSYTRDVIIILGLEHILILLKAFITMTQNSTPQWVIERIKKERYLEERHHEKIIFNYKKVKTIQRKAKQEEINEIVRDHLDRDPIIQKLLSNSNGKKTAPRSKGHYGEAKNFFSSSIFKLTKLATNKDNMHDCENPELNGLMADSKQVAESEDTLDQLLDPKAIEDDLLLMDILKGSDVFIQFKKEQKAAEYLVNKKKEARIPNEQDFSNPFNFILGMQKKN